MLIGLFTSIVMVHGLNGHWRDTWTAGDQIFWLKDLLPELVPNARIFSWGYDSRTHSSTPVSEEFIWGHGTNLVSDLTLERDATNVRPICPLLVLPLIESQSVRRPIIFVGHSLGGLVIKSV